MTIDDPSSHIGGSIPCLLWRNLGLYKEGKAEGDRDSEAAERCVIGIDGNASDRALVSKML